MKTLPLLTAALTLSFATSWAVLIYRQSHAQEKEKPAATAPTADQAADAKKKAAQKTASEKAPPRKNEASGAVAVISLEDAREKLINYQSIRAKVLESVSIGDRQFQLKGSYLQGDGLKLRLEYEVTLGSTEGKLLEVCDGQLLWSQQAIGKEQRVTRRNVRQILEAAAAAERTSETLLRAELGLGGLPGMMASIQKSVQFEKQWEQDYDGQEFIVIDGSWKPELRSKFVGPNADAEKPLPSFVPDRIRVYFEKSSMFPRRILYLKKAEPSKSLRPMVSLDFTDVMTNQPVEETSFSFKAPENVDRQDITDDYLRLFQKKPATEGESKEKK